MLLTCLGLALWCADLRMTSPTDFAAGMTQFVFETDLPSDDVVGIEVRIQGQMVDYLDTPPFETELDLRRYPQGPLLIEAELERFSGDNLVFRGKIDNAGPYVEQDVNLVRLPILVQQPDASSALPALSKSDFLVVENQQAVQLEYLMDEDTPLNLVVLIDISGSMLRKLPMVRHGVGRLLNWLRPQDRVKIVGFNHAVFEISDWETDKDKLKFSLGNLQPDGGTNLYGAIWSGVNIAGRGNERRAVMVFTDGSQDLRNVDAVLEKSKEDCIAAAVTHGVPIYTMGTGAIDAQVLQEVADRSGGKAFLMRGYKSISNAFNSLGQELKAQYLLCFYTHSRVGGDHQIQVSLPAHQNLQLHYPKTLNYRF